MAEHPRQSLAFGSEGVLRFPLDALLAPLFLHIAYVLPIVEARRQSSCTEMARAFGIAWRTRALEHYTGYDVDGRGVRESPLVGLEMEAGGEGNSCRGKLPCTS